MIPYKLTRRRTRTQQRCSLESIFERHDTVVRKAQVLPGNVDAPRRMMVGLRPAISVGRVGRSRSEGTGPTGQERQYDSAWTLCGGISGKLHVLSRNAQVGKERSTWETVMGHAKATAGMSYDEGRPIRDHQTVACNTRAIERGLHTVPARCGKVNPDKDTSLIQGRICASHSAFKLPVFGPDSGRFPRISPKLPRGAFAAMEPCGLAAGSHDIYASAFLRSMAA